MVTGFPFTVAVETILPFELATTKVFPEDEGAGSCISISIVITLPLIDTFISLLPV
jgi:hypothetical protein